MFSFQVSGNIVKYTSCLRPRTRNMTFRRKFRIFYRNYLSARQSRLALIQTSIDNFEVSEDELHFPMEEFLSHCSAVGTIVLYLNHRY